MDDTLSFIRSSSLDGWREMRVEKEDEIGEKREDEGAMMERGMILEFLATK